MAIFSWPEQEGVGHSSSWPYLMARLTLRGVSGRFGLRNNVFATDRMSKQTPGLLNYYILLVRQG